MIETSGITLDLRDVLIVLNIFAMVGGAFYMVGMLRAEISHLAQAIERQTKWLERVDARLNKTAERVASVEASIHARPEECK